MRPQASALTQNCTSLNPRSHPPHQLAWNLPSYLHLRDCDPYPGCFRPLLAQEPKPSQAGGVPVFIQATGHTDVALCQDAQAAR